MTFRIRLLTISCLAFSGLQCVQAADAEIFGGYSITRMKPENDSNHTTMNGWNTSVTAYATSRFGVTADFAGFYGTANTAATNSQAVSIRQYSFMAGPQFRLLRTSRITTSVRAVFGGAYGYLPGQTYRTLDQTTFAALAGSNFDVKVGEYPCVSRRECTSPDSAPIRHRRTSDSASDPSSTLEAKVNLESSQSLAARLA